MTSLLVLSLVLTFSYNQVLSTNFTCQCGVRNTAIKGRIASGKETKYSEFPMMGAIVTRKSRHFCGATVITTRHAVTAAHCTRGRSHRQFTLRVGSHHLREDGYDSWNYVLSNIYDYLYEPKTHDHDISLVETREKIIFSRAVSPACLLDRPVNLHQEAGLVLGWGEMEDSQSPLGLREGAVEILSLDQCLDKFNIPVDRCSRAFCAQSGSITNVCKVCTQYNYQVNNNSTGDSGGPLLWEEPETGRLAVVGVVSRTYVIRGAKSCPTTLPGVFVDITRYVGWIESIINYSTPAVQMCKIVMTKGEEWPTCR